MKLALFSAIFLQVAAAGAQVTPAAMWTIIRRPLWLPRVVLAMFVAVPLLAVVLAKTFDVPPAMDGAMLLLAISAAAPLLPGKLLKLGIEPAYDATLAAVTTLLAIVLVPLELNLLAAIFLRDATISVGAVAQVVAKSFLFPLALGMALNAAFGQTAVRLARPAANVAFFVMVALVVGILVAERARVFPLLGHSLPLVALFTAGSLLIGHVLGGPDRRERTSLAIATVTRHPGLALLMATTSLPNARELPSAIIAFVVGMAVATIPYNAWQKRQLMAPPRRAPVAAGVR